MVTWQNYEEYMMMLVDGELSSHEEQELMAFLAQHPELKNELAAFNMVKMLPSTDTVFENKEKLLKTVSSRRVIAFPVWQRYSIAAGVAAIIFITLFKFNPGENKVASVVPSVPVKTEVPVAPAPKQNVAEIAQPALVKPQIAETIAKVNSKPGSVDAGVKKEAIRRQEAIAKISQENINEIAVAGPTQISNIPTAAVVLKEAPALALVSEVEDQERSSLFSYLGIEDGKREGMEAVAAAVTKTLDKVQTIKQDIDTRSLSVRIENKRLILSF